MSKPKKLPLDSPNWMPLAEAYRLLCPRFGSSGLAAEELDAAVRDGRDGRRVPTMRRCFLRGLGGKLMGPERELLELTHWDERRLWVGSDDKLEVVEGPFRSAVRPVIYAPVKGYAYFVWKPALAKVWPDVFAPTTAAKLDDAQPAEPQQHKPRPKPTAEKAKPPEATTSKSRPQEACKQFALRKFPYGYGSIRTSVIMHAAEQDREFKRTVVPFPNRDVWLRALGRRKS